MRYKHRSKIPRGIPAIDARGSAIKRQGINKEMLNHATKNATPEIAKSRKAIRLIKRNAWPNGHSVLVENISDAALTAMLKIAKIQRADSARIAPHARINLPLELHRCEPIIGDAIMLREPHHIV